LEKKEENLENTKEIRDFKRRKLPEKYMVKILYRYDSRKFKNKYLKKLEKD